MWQRVSSYAIVLVAMTMVFTSKAFEDQFVPREVLRDNTATVVATGKECTSACWSMAWGLLL